MPDNTQKLEIRPEDRRVFPRLPADLEVDCRFEDRCQYTYATNVSAEGMYLHSRVPESPGAVVDLKLRTASQVHPLTLRGQVMWFSNDPLGPGMGIRFMDLKKGEREQVEHLLTKLGPTN